MTKALELTGQRFGKLLVLSKSHTLKRTFWNCICDCGATKVVQGCLLPNGRVTSCGCSMGAISRFKTTHGLSQTGAYSSWASMMERCYNLKAKAYKMYGAVGIQAHPDWHEFEAFYKAMGGRPEGTTLDRRDNAKGYEPGNCRWATAIEQARNKTSNHLLTIDGESHPVVEWAEISGITQYAIKKRIDLGWSPKEAVFTKKYGKYGCVKPPGYLQSIAAQGAAA